MRTANSRVTGTLLLAVAVTLMLAFLYLLPYNALLMSWLSPRNGTNATLATTTVNANSLLFSSLISGGGGKSEITYPPQYSQLASFMLDRINLDRANFSLSAVHLSSVTSGQQHADSMMYFGYLSHWDTQGLKPYVRYSLLNGTGAMEENVAYESTSAPTFTTLSDVESSLARLENQMMYADSSCCNNGHRDNILDPVHNFVSLGIEYNSTRVYLVEDFENSYISLSQPLVASDGSVNFVGTSPINLGRVQVLVYYDQYPQNLTAAQLRSSPYSGSYGTGEFVGGVVPPCVLSCEKYQNGVTVQADTWDVTNSAIRIDFNLTGFVDTDGKGIYTVYLEVEPLRGGTTPPETLVSVSVISG